ncbi:MAG: AAA family ATPase [Actinomycetota bacterium]|nr:AAA family ATPase [Actinomycetota bacterium]
MRFGLLGSLTAFDDDGRSLDLGGNQSRTVLAVLLAAAGRVVTAESLVDILWGEDPPASAPGTLQSYISRLRRELEPGRGRGEEARLLRWEPPGYRLAVDADHVDFRRFELLADQGRALLSEGRAAEARDVLLDADALWRGPALVEYRDREFAMGLVARLEDRRLAAAEDRFAAELALGRHAAAVGELAELVKAHPLQEGFRGLLALALYRSGRQSEALRALADARDTLREELGVDLGRPLRDLESAILAHDPSLDLPRATAVSPAQPSAPVAEPPRPEGLIGRDAELAQLLGALDEAAACLRVAIVEGEPGIGKTRLAEELGAEAARRGALVLWGRTFEGGAAPALWPWLPPLRALVAALPDPSTVAPELSDLLSPAAAAARGPTAAGPARFALMDAIADLLQRSAAARPVVLVLDDLQWADVESLELLTSMAGRLADAPLLVVVTVRELEVGRNDLVVGTLAALTRTTGARRLLLRGLPSEATDALVARTAGGGVDPDVVRAIHDRAEGNPFFTTELARLLASGQGLPEADVPSGVRDVVRRRLALLPERTAELLTVAAVIGRDVDLGLLAAASGRDLDTCLDDLELAILHRLLVSVPDQPGVHRFAHALMREVVVDDISSLRRARLHLRVADALGDVDDNAEIIAEHLWQAVPIGVAGRAAAALERAAGVAIRRFAYTTAEELLERAVQLRRTAGSDGAGQEAELRAVAFLVSVTGAHRGYAALIDSPLLVRGRHLAEETGSTRELVNLLWAEWAGLDVACRFDRADPIAEELLTVSKRTDTPAAPVLGHTAYGIARWHRGALREAAEHLDAAREAADLIPDGTLASVLFDLDQLRLSLPFSVYVHNLLGDLDDPEARYDEVVARQPGDRYWELMVSNFAASGALATGDLARAERAARRGLVADPEGIFFFWNTAGHAYLGASLALQGRIDEGLPLLEEAWARYTSVGLRVNGVTLLASRAQALAQAGRLEAAAGAMADAQRELATYGERYAEPALLLAEAVFRHAQGEDRDEVAKVFVQAAELATAQGGHGIARRIHRTAEGLGYRI